MYPTVLCVFPLISQSHFYPPMSFLFLSYVFLLIFKLTTIHIWVCSHDELSCALLSLRSCCPGQCETRPARIVLTWSVSQANNYTPRLRGLLRVWWRWAGVDMECLCFKFIQNENYSRNVVGMNNPGHFREVIRDARKFDLSQTTNMQSKQLCFILQLCNLSLQSKQYGSFSALAKYHNKPHS